MENIIFCFSGTGNSLSVAQNISKGLDNTEIVLIEENITAEIAHKRVGIVCPAYFGSLPPIVERFIAKTDFRKADYIFGCITAGAMHGKSVDLLGQQIAKHNGKLNAKFLFSMPGNYIAMYGAWFLWFQRFQLNKTNKKLPEVIKKIKEMQCNYTPVDKPITPLGGRMKDYEKFSKDYKVTDDCTACATCEKLCPTENIAIKNNKPKFGEKCEHCMACIQWCPTRAILYKDLTEKRKHYTNPNITVTDLFKKGGKTL